MGSGLGSHPSSHPVKGGVHGNPHQPAGGSSNITTTDAARIAQAWRDYASLLSASSVVSGAGISTIKEVLSPSLLSPSSLQHHRPFSGVIPVNALGSGALPTITTETIDALARQLGGGTEGVAREEETSILRRAFFTAVNEMKQVVSKAVMCETCEEDTPVKSPVKSLRSQSKLPVKQLASSVDANNESLYASDFECEDPKDQVWVRDRDQESDCEHVEDEVADEAVKRARGTARRTGSNGNVFELTTELQEQECDEIVEEDEAGNSAPTSTRNLGGLTLTRNSNGAGTNRATAASGPSEDEVMEDDEDKVGASTGPGQSNLKRPTSPVKSLSAQSNLPVKSTKQQSHLRRTSSIPLVEIIDEEEEDLHQRQQQQQQKQHHQVQQQAKGTEIPVPEDDDDDDDDNDANDEVEEESHSHNGGASLMNSRSGSVSRIPSMLSAASALDTERRPLRYPYPTLSAPLSLPHSL